MNIPQFSADSAPNEVSSALGEAGCAVVTGLTDPELRQAITAELAPSMAKTRIIDDDDPEEFYPGRTRRVSALVARSPHITDRLIDHPVS